MRTIIFLLFIIPTIINGATSMVSDNLTNIVLSVPNFSSINTNHSSESSTVKEDLTTLLFKAVLENNIEQVITLLLAPDINVNIRDDVYQTPLMYTTDDSLEIAKILIQNGAYVNTRDQDENTPLILASKNNQSNLVKLLLEHPISINSKNKDGFSALHYAVINGYTDIVALLIKKRADLLDSIPTTRTLPIIEATKQGYTMIVSLMIEQGISPNTTMRKTKTSLLSIASAYGNISTVELLLNKGADPNLVNILGVTPLFISIGKQQHLITKSLLQHGAKIDFKTINNLSLEDILSPNDTKTQRILKNYSVEKQ